MGHGPVVIGLMSGTSTDGIDAAAVEFSDAEPPGPFSLLSFVSIPYSGQMRARLLGAASDAPGPSELARLSFSLGGRFAAAAQAVMQAARLRPEDVLCVAVSGHTIAHLPQAAGDGSPPATLQIGEAAVVAEALGITVVSDFRVSDVAAGGQGAPLVPYFDFRFLRSETVNRAVLNIGGIANVTVLRAGSPMGEVIAFDTGPGNMPLDTVARRAWPDGPGFDADGAIARRGTIDTELVELLARDPYFTRPAPKSCGREQFGAPLVDLSVSRCPDIAPEDLIATLTELVGLTIGQAIARFRAAAGDPWEVLVSGGGAHNGTLVDAVRRHAGMPVRPTAALGVPVDGKEAIAFGYLAWETVHGRPSNVPSATGASGPRVLGRITRPPRGVA